MSALPNNCLLPDGRALPREFAALLGGFPFADVSGCSGARSYLCGENGRFCLKVSGAGTLAGEAQRLRYFACAELAPPVAAYVSGASDFLLTARAAGQPATDRRFFARPQRLACALGAALRALHERRFPQCPFPGANGALLAAAEAGARQRGEQALREFEALRARAGLLREDAVVHGDYCLPNILLDADLRVTALLDWGAAGPGDRHIDLWWGLWSLRYNLGSDEYSAAFLDAYGRDAADEARLELVGALIALAPD